MIYHLFNEGSSLIIKKKKVVNDFRGEIFTKISKIGKWLGLSSFKIK